MPAPRLLVSVVDSSEAAEAAGAGAHVVDAKDPSRGALGAVGAGALLGILRACPPGVETSAALGDLRDFRAPDGAGGLPLTYVKVGLGGETDPWRAERALEEVAARLGADRPPHLIVASYADHGRGGSPPPASVPALARRAGARGCLLDTAVKDGSCLLDWIGQDDLRRFVAECRALGLLCALAGSLRAEHLARVAALGPDLVGVRGAACDGDRVRGRVERGRVSGLAAALAAAGA